MVEKKSAINLLEAFAVAVKHYLRGEDGIYYKFVATEHDDTLCDNICALTFQRPVLPRQISASLRPASWQAIAGGPL